MVRPLVLDLRDRIGGGRVCRPGLPPLPEVEGAASERQADQEDHEPSRGDASPFRRGPRTAPELLHRGLPLPGWRPSDGYHSSLTTHYSLLTTAPPGRFIPASARM